MITQQGYFIFKGLKEFPEVIHGVSTRQWGDMFTASPECRRVMENRRKFLSCLGINFDQVVLTEQVHGDKIAIVGPEHLIDVSRDRILFPRNDAMITQTPGIYLAIFTADCIPMFFYDPQKRIVGLAHIGWRGTIKNLAFKTIKKIIKIGGKEDSIKVFFGPSIGPCHYDVGCDIDNRIRQFKNMFPEPGIVIKRNGKYFLDLWQANRIQLIKAGLKKENINNPGICTVCQSRYFSSYHSKKEKNKISMMSVIGLRT